MQENVYRIKRAQAQYFKDGGYDERMLIDVPFVAQSADLVGSSSAEAADDILFKAKLHEDLLAKTERLRLKYFTVLREAKSDEGFPELLERSKKRSISSTAISTTTATSIRKNATCPRTISFENNRSPS